MLTFITYYCMCRLTFGDVKYTLFQTGPGYNEIYIQCIIPNNLHCLVDC